MSGVSVYSVDGKTRGFRLKPDGYALLMRCRERTDLTESNTLYVLEALDVIVRLDAIAVIDAIGICVKRTAECPHGFLLALFAHSTLMSAESLSVAFTVRLALPY